MIKVECLHCKASLWSVEHVPESRRKKFCNCRCRRAYWNGLFDAMIASPDTMPLVQNYDEFLDSEELECLMPGCGWVGSNLSAHIWQFHGITAEKFKEAAGFNRRTGLIGKAVAAKLAASAAETLKERKTPAINEVEKTEGLNYHPGVRHEGREHFRKARLGRKHTEETKKKISDGGARATPPMNDSHP